MFQGDCFKQLFLLKPVEGNLETFRVKWVTQEMPQSKCKWLIKIKMFIRFRLLLNGSVVVRELLSKEWVKPSPGQYCLDGVQNIGNDIGPYTGDPLDQILVSCAVQNEPSLFEKNETMATTVSERMVKLFLEILL